MLGKSSKVISTIVLILMAGQLLAKTEVSVSPETQKIDLTRGWEFNREGESHFLQAQVPGTIHTDLLQNGKIADPFYRTNEADLQWIDKQNWEYRKTFNIDPAVLKRDHVEMVFEGLDTYAEVFLNGQSILKTDNMFRVWSVECKALLREKDNRLRVKFISAVNMDLPKLEKLGYQLPASNDQSERGGLGDKRISVFARKAPYHYGWDWGPRFVTAGIWRPVYLRVWNDARIESSYFELQTLTKDRAEYQWHVAIRSERDLSAKLQITWLSGEQNWIDETIQLNRGIHVYSLPIVIEKPRRWWSNGLGEPFLYDLRLSIRTERGVDTQTMDLGVRQIELIRGADDRGKSFYFKLNGIPVFAKGANYIPNDNFLPRVTEKRYEHIVRSAARANMNMLRVWGGGIYENDIFYQLCDRYGIMVWQDFMFACSMYPGDQEFLENVRREAVQNVRRLRNHASIVLWCGNNEIDAAWGQGSNSGWGWKERFTPEQRRVIWAAYDTLFHKILPRVIQEEDPSRTYWPSSPLADWGEHASYTSTSGDMHYWGVWHGKKRFEDFDQHIPRFMSEFGFQSFPEVQTIKKYTIAKDRDSIGTEVMTAHQRSGIGNERIREYMSWYYKVPRNFDDLIYMSQVLQAEGIKAGLETHRRARPFCMGTLYWQINDCWPVASWSSIDYYGRWKALHYFAAKAFRNILVSPVLKNDSLKIYIVSDEIKSQEATLSFSLWDFAGVKQKQADRPVTIPASSSQVFFKTPLKDFLGEADPRQTLLRVILMNEGEVLAQNILYFDLVKNLELPETKINIKLAPDGNRYKVTVMAEALSKNVFLQIPGSQGQFSDNYFDLLPGESKTIYFDGYEPGLKLDENDIRINTVNAVQKALQ